MLQITGALVIPEAELEFTAARSSGPGGQHVNTTASKVQLRFHVAASPSLPAWARAILLEKLASRLDADGWLQVSSQETRSQHRNRELALEKLRLLLSAALTPRRPRRPTRPSRSSEEKRLQRKKQRGLRKRERRGEE